VIRTVAVGRAIRGTLGHVKPRFPIPYADAFAVVTAQEHGAAVLTGDPKFASLADAGEVAIAWLPRKRP